MEKAARISGRRGCEETHNQTWKKSQNPRIRKQDHGDENTMVESMSSLYFLILGFSGRILASSLCGASPLLRRN
jgi:hypothetical protein